MGNTGCFAGKARLNLGSPPHTWGIPTAAPTPEAAIRITPTYVGNTGCFAGKARLNLGSPPHTWGIPTAAPTPEAAIRITPTYVGNTIRCIMGDISAWDHPHIHGEYLQTKRSKASAPGSPPHTWGILTRFNGVAYIERITPTYVGNTSVFLGLSVTTRDHPHIRGEYIHDKLTGDTYPGSPPHTWGIHVNLS